MVNSGKAVFEYHISACRGGKEDSGIQIDSAYNARSSYSATQSMPRWPTAADTLFIFSTIRE